MERKKKLTPEEIDKDTKEFIKNFKRYANAVINEDKEFLKEFGTLKMRDPKRIRKLLNLLQELWKYCPDLRFCQLLFNFTRVGTPAGDRKICDPFYYEDDDIIKDLEEALKKIKNK